MSIRRLITWLAFYVMVIGLTVSECWKVINKATLESYETLLLGWLLSGLIAGLFLSVLWPMGYTFLMFSILDRLERFAYKRLKLGESPHWFSMFRE